MNEKYILLRSFLKFVAKPVYPEKLSNRKFLWKFFDVLRLLALTGILSIPFLILITVINKAFNYNISNHAVAELVSNYSIIVVLLLGVILAPIIEELTFRLWLRFEKFTISLSIPFIIILITDLIRIIFPNSLPDWLFKVSSWQGIFSLTGFILVVALTSYLILKPAKTDFSFLKRNIRWIYYLSAILFGLVHITNYPNLGSLLIFTPIFVGPQLIAGFVLGFTRINYGIKWSMLAHMIFNGISMMPVLLLSLTSTGLRKVLFSGGTQMMSVQMTGGDALILIFTACILILIILIASILFLQMIIEWIINRRARS